MTTNSSPAQKLANANKTLRIWTIVFAVAAAVTIAGVAATGQLHVLSTLVMLFATAMVVLSVDKREKAMLVPVRA